MYLAKENSDLFTYEDQNQSAYVGKDCSYEISKINERKLESSTRMYIHTYNLNIIKLYAHKIIDWKWTIKEVYCNQISEDQNNLGILLLLSFLPNAVINIQKDSIDFMNANKSLRHNKKRISATSGIARFQIAKGLEI